MEEQLAILDPLAVVFQGKALGSKSAKSRLAGATSICSIHPHSAMGHQPSMSQLRESMILAFPTFWLVSSAFLVELTSWWSFWTTFCSPGTSWGWYFAMWRCLLEGLCMSIIIFFILAENFMWQPVQAAGHLSYSLTCSCIQIQLQGLSTSSQFTAYPRLVWNQDCALRNPGVLAPTWTISAAAKIIHSGSHRRVSTHSQLFLSYEIQRWLSGFCLPSPGLEQLHFWTSGTSTWGHHFLL